MIRRSPAINCNGNLAIVFLYHYVSKLTTSCRLYSPVTLQQSSLSSSQKDALHLSTPSLYLVYIGQDGLPSGASDNLGPAQHERDVRIPIPNELSQRCKSISSYAITNLLKPYRILSFGGGEVEKDSAHPLTVRSAVVNMDCFFLDPNFFTASRAFTISFDSCAALTASSPQHFLACRWSTPVRIQMVSICNYVH